MNRAIQAPDVETQVGNFLIRISSRFPADDSAEEAFAIVPTDYANQQP
jgi:hypothetical protein